MNSSYKSTLFWIVFCLLIGAIIVGVFILATKQGSATSSNAGLMMQVPVSASDHAIGSSTAPVVLVEYADFQCPACQSYAPMINQLIKDEGNKMLFVYRYFPLPQHQNAIPAARAAEAAGLQGKFWEMHDLLFANYAAWENQPNPSDTFLQYATSLGLDTAKFSKDEASQTVLDRIEKDHADAEKNQLTYTPTLFVNGMRINNPESYAAFKQLIDDAATAPAMKM